MPVATVKEKLKNLERVLRLARKPRKDEFIAVAKVTGIGLVIIGALGFIIRIIIQAIELL
jgi:protein transport protein SEC61 subunit gamma-like protein